MTATPAATRDPAEETTDPIRPPSWVEDARSRREQSALERLQERVHRACHDPVTGMPGRFLFEEHLEQVIGPLLAVGDAPTLLKGQHPGYLDAKRLKPLINTLVVVIDLGPLRFWNAHGSYVTDAMLRNFQTIVMNAIGTIGNRHKLTAYHLGGDEFAIIAEQTDPSWFASLLKGILRAYRERCTPTDPPLPTDANFGFVTLVEGLYACGLIPRYEQISSMDPLPIEARVKEFLTAIANERCTKAKLCERYWFLRELFREDPERLGRMGHLMTGEVTREQVEELAVLPKDKVDDLMDRFVSEFYSSRLRALGEMAGPSYVDQELSHIVNHLIVSATLGTGPFGPMPS